MTSTTNFFRQINKIKIKIQTKILIFQSIVIFSLFSLFLGFVMGNLFGTFLNSFRNLINWDGLIISLTILIIEFINYLNYKKKTFFEKKATSSRSTLIVRKARRISLINNL